MKRIIIYTTILSLVFLGCKKKDDDDDTPTPTKSSMLVGTWKVTASTVSPPIDFLGTPISDMYNSVFYPNCTKDDLYIFKSDKSYEFNEGPSKCDDSDPQITDVGTWAFNSDESLLLITPTGGTTEETAFESLTSSQFVVVFTELDSSTAVLYTFKQTLTKQ